MALPSNYGIEKNRNSMAGLSAYENGGPGSGNFGHAGRPGKRGGSGKGSGINVHSGSDEMDYYYAEDGDRVLASGKTEKETLEKAKKKLAEEKMASWDEPYKEFTKTDQIGTGDYAEAGFFTSGNFTVDAHLDAKDVVDSVKDYNILNDMLFEAETKDKLASTPEGVQIERLLGDLKGELHAQNAYSSATFETAERRRNMLLQVGAGAASIRDKLQGFRGVDRYNRYVDKGVNIANKTERRAITASNNSDGKWQSYQTAKPEVAGGTATSDRPMTKAYDKHLIEQQRKRASDLAYMFSR